MVHSEAKQWRDTVARSRIRLAARVRANKLTAHVGQSSPSPCRRDGPQLTLLHLRGGIIKLT